MEATRTLKNGAKVEIKHIREENLEGEKGSFVAFSNGGEVGCLRYRVEKTTAKLDYITISEKSFLGQGLGHALIRCFEEDMKKTNATKIVGVFSPMGVGASGAKKFYENHGYKFSRDRKTDDILVSKRVFKKRTQDKTF